MGLFSNSWSNTLKLFNLFKTSNIPHIKVSKTMLPYAKVPRSKASMEIIKGMKDSIVFTSTDFTSTRRRDPSYTHHIKGIKDPNTTKVWGFLVLPRYRDLIKNINDHIMGHLDYLKFYTS